MNPIQYLRERVWSELPVQVTTRQRVLAAVVWGGALMLIAFLKFRRLHAAAPQGSALVPALLAVGGAAMFLLMLIPSIGEHLYLAVMRICGVLGLCVSTVIFTLTFFLLVTPLGWALRLCGKDLLDSRRGVKPAWKDHPPRGDRKRYYRLS